MELIYDMNIESISFILIILIIMIAMGFKFYKDITKPIYVSHRAYKKWLIEIFNGDEILIAGKILDDLKAQHRNTYQVVEEMTGDKTFNSQTYIKTAKGIIKQIKYAEKYGYLDSKPDN